MKYLIKIIFFIFLMKFFPVHSLEITLYTEDYPPFNMPKDEKLKGISVEIIEKILTKLNIKYNIIYDNWDNSLNNSLKNKNSILFSTAKLNSRVKKFIWIGPIINNDFAFFSLKNNSLEIKKIDDIKKYKIGVYHSDAFTEMLISKGFSKNLKINTYDKQSIFDLKLGNIDLWATGTLAALYYSKQESIPVKLVYIFNKSPLYFALNKDFDKKIAEKIEKEFQLLKKDKFIAETIEKYK